ncbi:MAG: Gfo/Idh/MocA family oxidoreductase [Planctomycetes bacterium]|nr:Gfo/Idh/MocA family oxidoreductase [Planctomycetota bacterium]
MQRREFLASSAITVASATLLAADSPGKIVASERIRVGCVGTGGRAFSLVNSFSRNKNCEVVALADIDPGKFGQAVAAVEKNQGTKPQTVADFRQLIDDKSLDAIVVGTPDHWHAIPTILACLAGKDVYVEKPDGHNIVEGQRMVAAMKKHGRVIQMGTQARTTDRMKSAIEFLKTGALGKCLVARAWESAKQGSIGFPKDREAPPGVDYDMWLGPAPLRPFNPNRFHGRWRWFYDYGTGDLGNDGVHRLDMAAWALSAAGEAQGDAPLSLPTTVSTGGGKWYFDDMQEWPDTLQVTYEFGGKSPKLLTYEMRIWAPYGFLGESEAAAVYGDKGYIIIGNTRWKAFGPGNTVLAEGTGGNDEAAHVENFLDCIKSRQRPNADLETVGHPSSLLCHMGNVASRVNRKLVFDGATETFVNDKEANALRTRTEYRKPWVLPEV